jgi:hypothetical protein
MTDIRQDLAISEAEIAAGEIQIETQRRMIADIARIGENTAFASEILAATIELQERQIAHCNILKRQVAEQGASCFPPRRSGFRSLFDRLQF